jgi:hypothetical protein
MLAFTNLSIGIAVCFTVHDNCGNRRGTLSILNWAQPVSKGSFYGFVDTGEHHSQQEIQQEIAGK